MTPHRGKVMERWQELVLTDDAGAQ